MEKDLEYIRRNTPPPFRRRGEESIDSISLSPDSVTKITAAIAEMGQTIRDKGDRQE